MELEESDKSKRENPFSEIRKGFKYAFWCGVIGSVLWFLIQLFFHKEFEWMDITGSFAAAAFFGWLHHKFSELDIH